MSINLSEIASASATASGIGAIISDATNTVGITPQIDGGLTLSSFASIEGSISSTSAFANPQTFLFHYNGEESITLDADITDHFVESNVALQDHIARRPVTYSVTGYIG